MMELLEFLKTENIAFRRKLQSKSEALNIIQSQLLSCQQELDHLRRSSKEGHLKSCSNNKTERFHNVENVGQMRDGRNVDAIERLRLSNAEAVNKKLSDENKLLQFDIEDLKQKLTDANNDILVLRRQTQMRNSSAVLEKTPSPPSCTQHLEQLEHLTRSSRQLEQDVQSLLDEKQDLVKQRDIYYDKTQRLNAQVRNLLNIDNQAVDFDAIVMENKYLKQRVEDLQGEKKMWGKTVSKYKQMLSSNCQTTGKILSYDQIARHINNMTSGTQPDQNNLRNICITLLETLNEKNLLLQHQRKTNKILASRILQLESQNGKSANTCDVLLRGYSATGAQSEIEIEDSGKGNDRRISETSEASQESIMAKDDRVDSEEVIGKRSEDTNGNRKLELVLKNWMTVKNEQSKGGNANDLKDESEININKLSNTTSNGRTVMDNQSDVLVEQINDKMGIPIHLKQEDNTLEIKDYKIIERDNLFKEHHDIQDLPVELQKLVFQAMQDLENDEIKCL